MSSRVAPSVTLFPLVLAGLLAGLTYWLDLASRGPAAGTDGKLRHDPDYIIENFEVRRFDPHGDLQHTVVAQQMRHYPDDDSTIVKEPRLTYHREPPMFAQAREAWISSQGEHVQLRDDVRVTRTGQAGKPATVLTTSRLDVWPDNEVANTDQPVTITQGRTQVTGSGLNADNKNAVYVLEGPVNGLVYRDGKSSTTENAPQTPAPASIIDRPAAADTAPATGAAPTRKSAPPKPAAKPKKKAPSKPKPRR